MAKKRQPTTLKPDPRNARKHPARNKELIRRSLEEVGAGRSILVDGDDVVRAGNGVYEQAQALGLKVRVVEAAPDELIAVKRPDLVGERAERAALLDNRAGELAEWDADVLAATGADLLDGLFTAGELAALAAPADALPATPTATAAPATSSTATPTTPAPPDGPAFTPRLEPGIAEPSVTSAQVERKSEEMREGLGRQPELIAVTCPQCACEFHVAAEDLKS